MKGRCKVGYALCMSPCAICKTICTYNPMTVPSIRLNGPSSSREPICEMCMIRANSERLKRGLPALPVEPDAYEGCPEEELA